MVTQAGARLPGDLQLFDLLARPERFELPTSWFVAMRSIQLSYGRTVATASAGTTWRQPPKRRGRAS